MSSSPVNNKRIAKNTLMLYIRMFLMMGIALYTSRVILQVLGVQDYGIYNVVGGVIGMIVFLNASMAGCTQRFISFALGKNDPENLKKVFSTAFFIHLLIGIFVILIAETLGLWFIYNKLVIPETRMSAAIWTYHFAIAATFISIISVPYDADIIAHEKMSAFAFISLYDAVAKLAICYLLLVIPFDHLKTYALLVFIIQISDRIIYGWYCHKHFIESHVHLIWESSLFKKMLSFSGWDLYGNLSVTVRTQGVSMLLNMFFGPILNAAAGIASSVQGVVMGFASNVVIAIRPQIVKSYAQEDYSRFNYLIRNGAFFTFLLLMMITNPLIVENSYVLSLWLVKVPDYTTSLCQFTLIFNLFADLSVVIMCGIHATGQIKRSSIINGTLYLLVIPITYFAFKGGFKYPVLPFVVNIIAVLIGMLCNVYYLHIYCNAFEHKKFYWLTVGRCLISFLASLALLYGLTLLMEESFLRLVLVCISSVVISLIIAYASMNPDERRKVMQKIRERCPARSRI